MGGNLSNKTEIVKAESFHKDSLLDNSFLVFDIHGSLSAGGKMMVVLPGLGSCPYCYKLCCKEATAARARVDTSSDTRGMLEA